MPCGRDGHEPVLLAAELIAQVAVVQFAFVDAVVARAGLLYPGRQVHALEDDDVDIVQQQQQR